MIRFARRLALVYLIAAMLVLVLAVIETVATEAGAA